MNYTPDTEEIREYYKSGAWLRSDRSQDRSDPAEYNPLFFAEFDNWYTEEIRKAKEEAWDEGCESGEANEGCGVTGTEDAAENPYRKEQND